MEEGAITDCVPLVREGEAALSDGEISGINQSESVLRAGTCSCAGQGVEFLPYIFSHDDVRQILALASSHRGRFIWAAMLRTLILMLYCTRLRLGEAVRLRTGDVDLDRGILKVQHNKGRSRIVAIRPNLVAELRRYGVER